MITLYTGQTGSGKSHFVIKSFINILDNRTVITNILLNLEHPNYVYMDEGQISKFLQFISKKFDNVENFPSLIESFVNEKFYGALIILDEVHLLGFRSKNDSIINWLSVHRHIHQDVWLITQTLKKIYSDYLLDVHHHVDMIPPHKRPNKGLIGYTRYDGVKGDSLGTKFYHPDESIFLIYKTGKYDGSTNVFMVKLFLSVGFLLLALFSFVYFINSSFTNIGSMGTALSVEKKVADVVDEQNKSIAKGEEITNNCKTVIGTKFYVSKYKAMQHPNWFFVEPVTLGVAPNIKKYFKVYYRVCKAK